MADHTFLDTDSSRLSSDHMFRNRSAVQIPFKAPACEICSKSAMWSGLSDPGMQCVICKVVVHASCLQSATKASLPCMYLSPTKAELPRRLRPIRFIHGLGKSLLLSVIYYNAPGM